MADTPASWFYIQSATHPHHVLTVTNAAWQPGARIELRPLAEGNKRNQLWCFDQGFLVNKQSGCVMSTKSSDKAVENQSLIQSRRQPHESTSSMHQRWQHDPSNHLLQLQAHPIYCLNTQQVPRMVKQDDSDENGNRWEFVDELSVSTQALELQ